MFILKERFTFIYLTYLIRHIILLSLGKDYVTGNILTNGTRTQKYSVSKLLISREFLQKHFIGAHFQLFNINSINIARLEYIRSCKEFKGLHWRSFTGSKILSLFIIIFHQ